MVSVVIGVLMVSVVTGVAVASVVTNVVLTFVVTGVVVVSVIIGIVVPTVVSGVVVTFVVSGVVVTSVVVVDWIPNAAMCIRKPEPETRFWIFQTRKPGFGRTAPGLETLFLPFCHNACV